MLSKKDTEKILKMLKMPEARIAELLADGEVEIKDTDIAGLTILDDNGLTELKGNVKRGHEEAYPEIHGKTLNAKYELGLSTTDAKNLEKVYEALQAKAVSAANIAPNAQITELKASLKKLQDEIIPGKENEVKQWQQKYQEREQFDQYASVIPQNANKYLTTAEHVARVRGKVTRNEAGEAINPATGQAYKDSLEKPIMFDAYVSELYNKTDGWLQPAQSGGGQFHHSTQSNGHRSSGQSVDIDAIRSKYNTADPDQRRAMQAEITTATVNAAKSAA